LVARRFIAVFYPECKISNTLVEGQVGTIPFKASGKQILEPGWRIIYAKDKKKKRTKKIKTRNRRFRVCCRRKRRPRAIDSSGENFATKTLHRSNFTTSNGNCRKQVEDEELREMLKNNGIGRPSTRANIIETLFKENTSRRNVKISSPHKPESN
jgi:DNA topoisomerase-3